MIRFRSLIAALACLLAPSRAAFAEGSVVALDVTDGEHGGGRIHVAARFGNVQGPMRLDTGASSTRLRAAPWNAELPLVGQSRSESASGAVTRCADVEAQNVQLVAEQGNNIGRAKYVVTRCEDGAGDDLLGLDFFHNARFTLDVDGRRMAFPGAAGPLAPARRLGPDGRLVGVEARLGRAKLAGLIDSGAELSAVDRRFVERHRSLFRPVHEQAHARDAGGAALSAKLYKVAEIDFGAGRTLRDLYVIAYDFGSLRGVLGRDAPLILGVNALRPFLWTFDFTAPEAPKWRADRR
ncbi:MULTISPECIES: aspartyl protease family protein [Methylosinus]|uniref:Peptidase A2 domain-containing protein n=1 Tax=Methylosinus trichosporium (strain ATCC 35070 / NCIMB 11131 / UNIQEM 75 / OB3b) TaxID=595536 RepID=A0A2D2CZ48_METT3|nr:MULTISPECIES: aspartyl protease family protein [Methylosinus]ATQ68021.1 hypothetical protein CQW49_09070 [Methylosinus trichosporium OB3b]OBS53703.1 hypothetical protein A8B73_04140 [Methylosinus sp. 3S-1]